MAAAGPSKAPSPTRGTATRGTGTHNRLVTCHHRRFVTASRPFAPARHPVAPSPHLPLPPSVVTSYNQTQITNLPPGTPHADAQTPRPVRPVGYWEFHPAPGSAGLTSGGAPRDGTLVAVKVARTRRWLTLTTTVARNELAEPGQ